MKILAVIPARYSSSRLPGKPLLMINGKPIFYWVYVAAKNASIFDKIIVATEDQRILESCQKYGVDTELTSNSHETGTDRVAEIARKLDYDIYVNIQGDEPLIESSIIKKAVDELIKNPDLQVVNLMTRITNPIDLINDTIPKVVVNNNMFGLYLSRSAVPYPKGIVDYYTYKQVCVYAFRKSSILKFSDLSRSRNERIEDIEILRFIDNDIKVKFVEVSSKSIAIDTQKDYKLVKSIMESQDA
jgi:3-deoxy-manno-octulosonate cytidylyltransferase (CMP-KDO synthetase)